MTDKTNPSFNPSHVRDAVSSAGISRIYEGVKAQTLPKPEWTHAAHLIMACALLNDAGLAEAEQHMPGIIRRYNEATGVENSNTDGYHHTITLFYLRMIAGFLKNKTDLPLVERVQALLASPNAERSWPLQFYSSELLFSVEARRGWVDPDLKQIAD